MLAEHAEKTGRRFLAYRETPAEHWFPGDGIGARLVGVALLARCGSPSIYTYPVKGCHRVEHDDAGVEPWGLAGDRRWMIVDADGVGVT